MIAIGRFFVRPICPAPFPIPETPAPAPAEPPKAENPEEEKEAPIVGVNTHVELVDYCAQVRQVQRFRNNEGAPLEATFEFELPKDCAVSSFSADIGDRHLTGTVKEKQRAEDDYDDALAAGHSAAMLKTKDEDPNTFCVQLGNIAPGTEAFVTLTYEMLASLVNNKLVLTIDGSDSSSIVFAEPPANATANDARVEPGFSFDVHIATKSPVRSVSSPSHQVVVELGDGATVRLAEGVDWRENKNFVLEVAVADPHQPCARVQERSGTRVAMVSFYPHLETPNTKCEMIFVLDRSGSMGGSAIECAKNTLQFFLRSLPEESFFNIVSFGSSFESFSPKSLAFNDKSLESATEYVKGLLANLGGTNIYKPLKSIFNQDVKPGYPRQVFVLTDGDVLDKENCISLVKQNAHTTRLFAFGIGNDVDKELVNGMAKAGEGSCSIVRETSAIRASVMKQLEHALQPALTDVKITWTDAATGEPLAADSVRQTPHSPPPIFRGTRLVAFAILPEGCKPCKATLTGQFDETKFSSEVVVDPTAAETVVPGEQIVKLGVRSLIKDIESGTGGIPADDKEAIKKAVIELSTKNAVLSRYTAFVAIGSGGEALEATMVTRHVSRRVDHSSPCFGFGAAPMMCYAAAPVGCAPKGASRGSGLFSGIKKMFRKGLSARACASTPMECCLAAPLPPGRSSMLCNRGDSSFEDEVVCDFDVDVSVTMEGACPPEPEAPGLDGIIMEQKASGCFGAAALEMLGLAATVKDAVPKNAPAGLDAKTAQDVWVTVLVLAGLKERFGDKASEWTVIARKSEKWARGKLGDLFAVWMAAAEAMF